MSVSLRILRKVLFRMRYLISQVEESLFISLSGYRAAFIDIHIDVHNKNEYLRSILHKRKIMHEYPCGYT